MGWIVIKYYAELLGQTIKKARIEQGLNQAQLAAKANVDVRTIINIEKNRGNPKLEVLFSLINVLKIDAREIFNPEMFCTNPAIQKLRFLIEDCSQEEINTLKPVIEAVLQALRQQKNYYLQKQK